MASYSVGEEFSFKEYVYNISKELPIEIYSKIFVLPYIKANNNNGTGIGSFQVEPSENYEQKLRIVGLFAFLIALLYKRNESAILSSRRNLISGARICMALIFVLLSFMGMNLYIDFLFFMEKDIQPFNNTSKLTCDESHNYSNVQKINSTDPTLDFNKNSDQINNMRNYAEFYSFVIFPIYTVYITIRMVEENFNGIFGAIISIVFIHSDFYNHYGELTFVLSINMLFSAFTVLVSNYNDIKQNDFQMLILKIHYYLCWFRQSRYPGFHGFCFLLEYITYKFIFYYPLEFVLPNSKKEIQGLIFICLVITVEIFTFIYRKINTTMEEIQKIHNNERNDKAIQNGTPGSTKCISCHQNSKDIVFKPCHHVIYCQNCTDSIILKQCIICNSKITSTEKIFI